MTLTGTGHTKETQCDTTFLIVWVSLETNTKTTTEETALELMEAHFVHHTMCETKTLCKVRNIMIAITANKKIPETLEILDLARVSAMFRSSLEQKLLFLNTWEVLSKG